MSSSSYREILRQAWTTVWSNKILWLWGFFALVLLGNNRAYNLIVNNLNAISGKDLTDFYALKFFGQTITSFDQTKTILGNIVNFAADKPSSFFLALAGILIGIIVIFALIWLVITSQISLIQSVQAISEGRKTGIKESIKKSRNYFWPVLGLNIIIQITIFVLFFIFVYPIVAYTSFFSTTAAILFVIFFLVFIPLSIILAFLTIYSSSYIILKNQKIFTAIKSAWHLFRKNWLPSLEVGLILLLIDIGLALGIVIITFLLFIPFSLLFVIFYFIASDIALSITSLLLLITVVALVLLSTSILSAFQYSVWTLLFLSLTEKSIPGKIFETLASIKKHFTK
jgi:hypothetical protein